MCLSLDWLMHALIWLVVICAAIALVRLLISFVLPHLGIGAEIVSFIVRAAWIILWAVICVAAIYFIFSLVACLVGGVGLPHLR